MSVVSLATLTLRPTLRPLSLISLSPWIVLTLLSLGQKKNNKKPRTLSCSLAHPLTLSLSPLSLIALSRSHQVLVTSSHGLKMPHDLSSQRGHLHGPNEASNGSLRQHGAGSTTGSVGEEAGRCKEPALSNPRAFGQENPRSEVGYCRGTMSSSS